METEDGERVQEVTPEDENVAGDAPAQPSEPAAAAAEEEEEEDDDSSESEELSDLEDGPGPAVVDGWATLMGEDVRLKNLSCPNPQSETASVQSDVCCSLTMSAVGEDGEAGPVLYSLDNAIFRIGAGDTIPALELGLRYSRLGDEFLLRTSSKFAYGAKGLVLNNQQIVPPDSNLELRVTVHSITEAIPPAEMNEQQIEHELNLRKAAGNRLLAEGEPQRALRCYGQCLKMLEGSELDMTRPELTNVRKLIIDMLNNTAMVHLQMQEYKKAKESCISVLEIDPDNVKALYRAGKAAIYTADYDEAEAALQKAMALAPNDPKIVSEYRERKKRERAYNENSKQMFKSMSKHMFAADLDQPSKDEGDNSSTNVADDAHPEQAERQAAEPEAAQQQQQQQSATPSSAAEASAAKFEVDSTEALQQPAANPNLTSSSSSSSSSPSSSQGATTATTKRPAFSYIIPAILGVVLAIVALIFQQQR
jgi:FK506-binding protein 8